MSDTSDHMGLDQVLILLKKYDTFSELDKLKAYTERLLLVIDQVYKLSNDEDLTMQDLKDHIFWLTDGIADIDLEQDIEFMEKLNEKETTS